MGHRDQLLEAARRLLEERGYAHITARDLVAASDTNLASIGYHFGSKAALLNAAIEASFDDWAAELAATVMSEPDATPLARAGATWVAVLARLPERRNMLQAYVEALAQALRVPELRAQLAEHYRRARAMVAELVARSLGEGLDAERPAVQRGGRAGHRRVRRAGDAVDARPRQRAAAPTIWPPGWPRWSSASMEALLPR